MPRDVRRTPFAAFARLNADLRRCLGHTKRAPAQGHQDLVAAMDRLLGWRRVPEDLVLVRGVPFAAVFPLGAPRPADLVTDQGYSSAALGETPSFVHLDACLHIRVPAGMPTVPATHFSHLAYLGERELLIPAPSMFYVHTSKQVDGVHHVNMEFVPPHQRASVAQVGRPYGVSVSRPPRAPRQPASAAGGASPEAIWLNPEDPFEFRFQEALIRAYLGPPSESDGPVTFAWLREPDPGQPTRLRRDAILWFADDDSAGGVYALPGHDDSIMAWDYQHEFFYTVWSPPDDAEVPQTPRGFFEAWWRRCQGPNTVAGEVEHAPGSAALHALIDQAAAAELA